jgi:hypothetical protein
MNASSESPVHASGFPAWGPPTLCGREGPTPPGGCGEVTCEACFEMLRDPRKLVARVDALEAEIGPWVVIV